MSKANILASLFISVSFASIASGLFLTFYLHNPAWLLLCAPIVFFLS